jgi:hypothetical protein
MHITSSQTPSIAEEAIHLLIRAAQEGRNLAQGARYKTLSGSSRFLSIARPNSRGNQAVRDEIRSILEARIAEEHAAKATDNVDRKSKIAGRFELSRTDRHSQKGKGADQIRHQRLQICCETHQNRDCSLDRANQQGPSGTFIPFSMAKSDPVAFGRLISKRDILKTSG